MRVNTCLKVIVCIHLAGELLLQPIKPGTSTLLVKDPLLLGPGHETTPLALELEQIAQTRIVAGSPENKEDQEQPALDGRGQGEEHENLNSHDSEGEEIKRRLFLAHVKDLAQHVLGHRHAKD